ncbi:tyrosine--tRNA ligase [Candidatus Microgenomates bacterium]|nr:tyrosine--tRNA ligase [Candidatus Microgenomates bacterium]
MAKSTSILERGVAKVLPSQEGLQRLMSTQKIRVYLGVDPTGARLHIGHAVGIRKLMEFAQAGHEAILLFGTGTVLVGDPSQRAEARKLVNQSEIDRNIASWQDQVKPIVDFERVTVRQNGEWLLKLKLAEIVEIASHISSIQLFKREMFQRRLAAGDTVWYHETMYPLLQGYDSVALDVDLEIGGTDQEFNMLIGRELQKKMKNREKFVLTVPMIVGTDGQPMSKTTGNCVWLDDPAEEMLGKLMTIPDNQIVNYLELVTNVSAEAVEQAKTALAKGANPRDLKLQMAEGVVKIYRGAAAAKQAREAFETQFSKGEMPVDIPVAVVAKGEWAVAELLVKIGLSASKSAALRVLSQGGVRLNTQSVETDKIEIKAGDILQVGKRHFIRIK